MASVHLVCVSEDVSRAEGLAELFEGIGFSVAAEGDSELGDDDVAVLVWSDASPRSAGFMNNAQRFMDEGRAVIASFVAIADPSGIGAPVFDLSDWDGRNLNEEGLVPLIYAVEQMMGAPAPLVLSEETADFGEADDGDVEEAQAAVIEQEPEPEPLILSEPEPEPEPLRAQIVDTPPPIKTPAKRRTRAEKQKSQRERSRKTRGPIALPPSGRVRTALPFVGAIAASIAALVLIVPLFDASSQRTPLQSAPVQVADQFVLPNIARAQAIMPQQLAELAPMPSVRIASIAPAVTNARSGNSLFTLASATTTRPRRAHTPRNITSWEIPDPKRRAYLAANGVEPPAEAAAEVQTISERKPKDG